MTVTAVVQNWWRKTKICEKHIDFILWHYLFVVDVQWYWSFAFFWWKGAFCKGAKLFMSDTFLDIRKFNMYSKITNKIYCSYKSYVISKRRELVFDEYQRFPLAQFRLAVQLFFLNASNPYFLSCLMVERKAKKAGKKAGNGQFGDDATQLSIEQFFRFWEILEIRWSLSCFVS